MEANLGRIVLIDDLATHPVGLLLELVRDQLLQHLRRVLHGRLVLASGPLDLNAADRLRGVLIDIVFV